MQSQDFSRLCLVGMFGIFERDKMLLAAALLCEGCLGVINQDLAHGHGGEGEEVGAVFEGLVALGGEFEIGLVDEDCGLQQMAGSLADEAALCDAVQLIVDERHQGVEGRMISSDPIGEEPSDIC
jgi:hypothetical protein